MAFRIIENIPVKIGSQVVGHAALTKEGAISIQLEEQATNILGEMFLYNQARGLVLSADLIPATKK